MDEQAPSIEDARRIGATGGPADEGERLAFEAWMAGHCWALCATWSGTEYRSDGEQGGWPDPAAMRTRQLWAAWRDRAALSRASAEPFAELVEVLIAAIKAEDKARFHWMDCGCGTPEMDRWDTAIEAREKAAEAVRAALSRPPGAQGCK